MEFSKIKETCLYVKDLEATKAFYHDKLGLPVISHVADRHVFFRAGSSVLLCFIAASTKNETTLPPHFGEGQLHMAFEAKKDEYEAWKALLSANGIPIEKEQDWSKGRKSAYFRDPDGHCIEIVEPGIWGD